MTANRSSAMSLLVPLKLRDWCPQPQGGKGYFRCRALGLPSAEVVRLRFEDEETVPEEHYEIKGRRLYWKTGVPPGGMELELKLRRRLLSARETVLAAFLGLLIGGYAMAYHPHRIQAVAKHIESVAMEKVPQMILGTSHASTMTPHGQAG
jgi:hypothetical protein